MDGPRCIGRCGYEELTSHALLVGHGADTTAKKSRGSIWQWPCVLDLGTCSRAEVVQGSHTAMRFQTNRTDIFLSRLFTHLS